MAGRLGSQTGHFPFIILSAYQFYFNTCTENIGVELNWEMKRVVETNMAIEAEIKHCDVIIQNVTISTGEYRGLVLVATGSLGDRSPSRR